MGASTTQKTSAEATKAKSVFGPQRREQLAIADWRAKQQTRATIQTTIRFTLNELPEEPYPSPFGTRRWMWFGPSSSRDGSNRQAGRRAVRLAENLVEDQATKIVLVCSADLTVNFASQKIVGISTAHCLYQGLGYLTC